MKISHKINVVAVSDIFVLHADSTKSLHPTNSDYIAFRSLKSDFQLIKRFAFSTAIKKLKLLLQFPQMCGEGEKAQKILRYH